MPANPFRSLAARSLAAVCLLALLIIHLPAQVSAPQTESVTLAAESAPVDIVVQGALDVELQPLLAALEEKREIQLAAWTFWRGKIAGRSVVISRTEVGPINAVAATTLAITHFRPRLVINQGTAGANDPDLKVFDIIIGESTVDYGAFQFSAGQSRRRRSIVALESDAPPAAAGWQRARAVREISRR